MVCAEGRRGVWGGGEWVNSHFAELIYFRYLAKLFGDLSPLYSRAFAITWYTEVNNGGEFRGAQ